MKKLHLNILLIGIMLISISAIIGVIIFDCKKYGQHLAYYDVIAIFVWLIIGNIIINKKRSKL
jgi:ABC-type uncharacterized transport system permease subunit